MKDRIRKAEETRIRHSSVYEFIKKTYSKYRIPVDKFGHFHSQGAFTVDDLVKPDFLDSDFIIANSLEKYGE